jgi:hypothetical protein
MGEQFYLSGKPSGSQFERLNAPSNGKSNENVAKIGRKEKDDDLVIEDNTIYEIDRECYDRLKRQKRRKD